MKLADIVLREAKEKGRNCCVLADEETLAEFEERGVFIQASEMQLALERGSLNILSNRLWVEQSTPQLALKHLLGGFCLRANW